MVSTERLRSKSGIPEDYTSTYVVPDRSKKDRKIYNGYRWGCVVSCLSWLSRVSTSQKEQQDEDAHRLFFVGEQAEQLRSELNNHFRPHIYFSKNLTFAQLKSMFVNSRVYCESSTEGVAVLTLLDQKNLDYSSFYQQTCGIILFDVGKRDTIDQTILTKIPESSIV